MKYFSLLKTYCCLLILGLLFNLCSCNIGVKKDDHIDATTRNEINSICKQIYKSIQLRNSSYIKSIASDSLKKDGFDQLDAIIQNASLDTTNTAFKMEGEFLINNFFSKIRQVKYTSDSPANDYLFRFTPTSKQNYIELFSIPSKNDRNSILVSCVFGMKNNEWKLDVLYFGPYRIDGNNAMQLYNLAKKKIDNGDLMSAVMYTELARECALPAGEYFHYNDEPRFNKFIQDFNAQLSKKFVFPIKATDIKTQPEILSVKPQLSKEGIYPYVLYKTKIPLTDTASLQQENDQLHNEIDALLPHIRKSFDTVLYKAVNDYSANGTMPQYGFVKKS